MGLREQAGLDLIAILEDRAAGFGWDIVITSPAGVSLPMIGFSTDIGQTIDPDTGVFVSGRKASVALPIQKILAAGLSLPRAISDSASKPWLVQFLDIHGRPHVFKVQETMPDTAIGCHVCILEMYKGPP